MKTISYTIAHYGSDYIGYAIQSVYPFVDECHIVYTDTPSHGSGTSLKNPDSKELITYYLYQFGDPQNKIKWHEGRWPNEGAHRMEADRLAKEAKADAIVVVDADEIWLEQGLIDSLKYVEQTDQRVFKTHMIHFWRSFGWVCTDQMMPDRIIKLKGDGSKGYGYLPNHSSPILHFGYARALHNIFYKISCHGHKGEWRANWFEEKYKPWRPGCNINDVHPTCVGIWNPQPFDRTTMSPLMKRHMYYNLDLIEQ